MNERSALVTSVGGDIGQSVLKCLKDVDCDFNFKIVGCDTDKYSASKGEVDDFLIAPPAIQEEKYIDFIKNVFVEKRIDYIFFLSEPEIDLFNRNRDFFSAFRTRVLVNDKYIVDTFMDKYKTYLFLKNSHLPYADTFLPSESNAGLRFPLLIKLRKGYGGRGLIKVNNSRELDFYIKNTTQDIILQEKLPEEGNEYTVGIFADGKDIFSIAFRRRLGYGSLTKIAELVVDKDISEIARKIAVACKLKGSINVQLKRREESYIPLEINPRFSSTVYFRNYFGFRDVLWWIYLTEGRPIDYKLKYKKGVGVRKLSEVFFDLS